MIASRYGSVPIVRETGGLKDSIKPFDGENGNGYVFKGENPNELLEVLKQAVKDYNNKELHSFHIDKAMKTDFGWSASAKSYVEMYKKIN